MTVDQLARTLQSVGYSCFVKFLPYFQLDDIVERLKSETTYTEKSCRSRTGHARRIIKSGCATRALQMVISSDSSKLSEATRAEAKRMVVS